MTLEINDALEREKSAIWFKCGYCVITIIHKGSWYWFVIEPLT